MKFLAKHTETAYALLRIMSGSLFLCHGLQKVAGILGGHIQPLGSQLWIGGVIELVAGLAITLGLFTRYAAFISSGMMAVAYTQFHWKFQMGGAFFPVINRGELAVLYCFVFLLIACQGGLKWCLDKED